MFFLVVTKKLCGKVECCNDVATQRGSCTFPTIISHCHLLPPPPPPPNRAQTRSCFSRKIIQWVRPVVCWYNQLVNVKNIYRHRYVYPHHGVGPHLTRACICICISVPPLMLRVPHSTPSPPPRPSPPLLVQSSKIALCLASVFYDRCVGFFFLSHHTNVCIVLYVVLFDVKKKKKIGSHEVAEKLVYLLFVLSLRPLGFLLTFFCQGFSSLLKRTSPPALPPFFPITSYSQNFLTQAPPPPPNHPSSRHDGEIFELGVHHYHPVYSLLNIHNEQCPHDRYIFLFIYQFFIHKHCFS